MIISKPISRALAPKYLEALWAIRDGADPNQRVGGLVSPGVQHAQPQFFDKSALYTAVTHLNVELVQELIDRGCACEQRFDQPGSLLSAASIGYIDVLIALLDEEQKGNTIQGSPSAIALEALEQTVKILHEQGVSCTPQAIEQSSRTHYFIPSSLSQRHPVWALYDGSENLAWALVKDAVGLFCDLGAEVGTVLQHMKTTPQKTIWAEDLSCFADLERLHAQHIARQEQAWLQSQMPQPPASQPRKM